MVENLDMKAALAADFNQRQRSAAPAVIVRYTDLTETLATIDEIMDPGMDAATRGTATRFTPPHDVQAA